MIVNKEADAEENEEIISEWKMERIARGEDRQGSSLWLITFTDIMALMLTFFVLLYSMSVPSEEEWKEITSGIASRFSKTYSDQWNKGAQDTVNINKIDFNNALNLGYLNTILENLIDRDKRIENIVLIPQTDHLIISVPQELLFDSGSSEISTTGKQVLYTLGSKMARIRNRIEVIGHSDPEPITKVGGQFASNWELSLARAGSVASILENAGYQRPIIVRGLSSARYEDLPEDMSEEVRLSLARRVDIVVMKDDGSERNNFEVDIFQ